MSNATRLKTDSNLLCWRRQHHKQLYQIDDGAHRETKKHLKIFELPISRVTTHAAGASETLKK